MFEYLSPPKEYFYKGHQKLQIFLINANHVKNSTIFKIKMVLQLNKNKERKTIVIIWVALIKIIVLLNKEANTLSSI